MTDSSQKHPSHFTLPLWAQLTLGFSLVGIVYVISINSTSFLSDWHEENSNFYEIALDTLKMFHVHPTAPTAVIFWSTDCQRCEDGIKSFRESPGRVRIYGVHLSTDKPTLKIRQEWLKYAPPRSALLVDRQQLLQTSFHVKAPPEYFIILPKQKKIYSYFGNIDRGHERMLELIRSEY